MNVQFLGTGTSHGVPVVGCSCAVCRSTDPRDNRYRSSVLVTGDAGEVVLIDAGPEFRLQALRAGLVHLDAVLITHAHADHVHGLDDVRPLTRGQPLRVYASSGDIAEIRERFSYAFREHRVGGGKPRIELVEAGGADITVGSLSFRPLPLMHGDRRVLGYRVGGFAYLTDCSGVPASTKKLLTGLNVMVIDGLRKRPHPTHFSVDEALGFAREMRPDRVFLTHICHDHSHVELEDYCSNAGLPFPAGPAYDGLTIAID
ncbi:MAG: MBL fold metallo-hydrolase [Spirochaetales bacterium]|nr:MBL fold metallo-hydrolase [Spirochaetales bacterium]